MIELMNFTVEELQEKLSVCFEISKDGKGEIQIYNLIEEYQLPQEEIHILLSNL